MLQATVIGNVGADAQVNTKDGREFVTLRVAHNDSWTDQAGQQHTQVIWVDVILNGKPKVTEFLKQGIQVAVTGRVKLRTYSSEKDRCMKAGMTISADYIQLLGGASDDVPRKLFDDHGVMHDVKKFYHTDVANVQLLSQRGDMFAVDANGWVSPFQPTPQPAAQQNSEQVDRSADGAPAF